LDDASGDTQIEQRRTRRNDYQGGVTRRYESMPCAGRHIDEQDFNPAALCQRDTLLNRFCSSGLQTIACARARRAL
jgi:hypothetical protein